MMVITEDALYEPADAEDCSHLAERVGPGWIVAYDPDKALEAYGTNDLVMITDASATVVYKRQGSAVEAIETVLRRLLPE